MRPGDRGRGYFGKDSSKEKVKGSNEKGRSENERKKNDRVAVQREGVRVAVNSTPLESVSQSVCVDCKA